jgi:hypothetical protein
MSLSRTIHGDYIHAYASIRHQSIKNYIITGPITAMIFINVNFGYLIFVSHNLDVSQCRIIHKFDQSLDILHAQF